MLSSSGKLSFASAMLDNDNNDGFTWRTAEMAVTLGIKEIVRGESYIELSGGRITRSCIAVKMYDPDVQDAINHSNKNKEIRQEQQLC